MDHLGDARCCEALERALRDPSSLVRRHAVHAVGCQKCKPHPLPMDIVGAIVERMLGDSSPRVRRVAAHQIGLQPYDLRAIEALQHVIAVSRDAGLVSRARRALCEQMAHAEPRCAANSR
jgi:HEAT repeat protein